MTENALQDAILETAALLRWLCMHPRPARTSTGWRTAAQGNGAAGYPDLTLVRNGYLIFAELKSATGKLAPAQRVWMDELLLVSMAEDRVLTFLWTPDLWLDGTVERVLRETGKEQPRRAPAKPKEPRNPGGRPRTWTPETLIGRLHAWADTHDGEPPTASEWSTKPGLGWPSVSAYQGVFGSWAKGLAAAGFGDGRSRKRAA